MNEIKCPKCGEVFTVDEAGYSAILNQVRTKEFDKELQKQLKVLSEKSQAEHDIAIKEAISEKDNEIIRLNEQIDKIKTSGDLKIEAEIAKVTNQKDEEIAALNIKLAQADSDLKQSNSERDIAIKEAISEKENEIARLNEKINSTKESADMNSRAEIAKITSIKDSEIADLKMKIQQLEAEAKQSGSNAELAISNAVKAEKEIYEKKLNDKIEEISQKNEELIRLDAKLNNIKLENELALKEAVSKIEKERDTQRAQYEAELKAQQESLEYYKDLKAKMSTKMIGETLEQHCENSFNMIRSTAFRNAEFNKDNNVADGTKGDYIYREKDDEGNEILSIMFEMKNEMDQTATKHKNEDFFDKLDKDRKKKKCEYAILVSLLESDSELYNQGIVDVSYEHEKMYVIRPQFFIPIISILRNAAMNSMEYKRQLAEIKNQEIDITHFEEKIEDFKNAFSKNYDLASRQFNTAIEEIDKTIEHLNKVKDNLQKSLNNLRLANNKAQTQLTIKALTKDNDTMIEMFDQLDKTDTN